MIGDLSLQVLAAQSGGLVLNGSNDLTALLEQSVADGQAYYELSFDPPRADHPDEYHHIEVQVEQARFNCPHPGGLLLATLGTQLSFLAWRFCIAWEGDNVTTIR